MASKYITVWDNAGVKCNARSVDAVEILANGGSATEPSAEIETHPVTIHNLEDATETVEPPKAKKAK